MFGDGSSKNGGNVFFGTMMTAQLAANAEQDKRKIRRLEDSLSELEVVCVEYIINRLAVQADRDAQRALVEALINEQSLPQAQRRLSDPSNVKGRAEFLTHHHLIALQRGIEHESKDGPAELGPEVWEKAREKSRALISAYQVSRSAK